MFEFGTEERSIAPTPRRLAEARRDGHGPRSRELTSATAALSAAATIGFLGGDLWRASCGLLEACWSAPVTRFAELDLSERIWPLLARQMLLLAAIVGVPAVTAAIVAALQAGFRATVRLPAPRWSQVSPGVGWRRIRAGAGLLPFCGLCLKIASAGLITAWMLSGDWSRSGHVESRSVATAIGSVLAELGLLIASGSVLVAISDWLYRRSLFMRGLRMTPTEARADSRASRPRRRLRTFRRDRVSDLPAASASK